MPLHALATPRQLRLATLCAGLGLLACLCAGAQDDPPDQAGRISAVYGTVSVQPAGSDDWGPAENNLPLGPGGRIYTDQDGRAEIQVGQTYLRIGPNTDITLVNDDANGLDFGLAQGAVHVKVYGLWQGQSLDISTPNGDARLDTAGELRVDAMPDQGATIFTSINNSIVVTGAGGFSQQMNGWQSLELAGTNPVNPQWLQPAQLDDLDHWSQQQDAQIANAASYGYVNQDVPGAADLDANGDWTPDSDYGPIWFPRAVSADWAPYRNGHWINRDPWGWVWVEDEPWGYAPFHYGRWVSYRGRWGWVPGPREQRPVWSPALVVFAGGINVGGAGVSAWFPLGPGEAYRPWYPCSPRYIDRVNITNIRESRVVRVQTTYVNIVNVRNVTYVNRTIGVSAMRPADFASGRPVRQASVQVDLRQMDRVTVVDRPAPVTRQSFVPRPVGRPVPVSGNRPVFINQKGLEVTTRPGAPPVQPPVRPVPPMRTIPGRTVVAPPSQGRFQNPGGNQQQQQYPGKPVGRPQPPAENRQYNGSGQNGAGQNGAGQNGNSPQNSAPAPERPMNPVGRPQPPVQERQFNGQSGNAGPSGSAPSQNAPSQNQPNQNRPNGPSTNNPPQNQPAPPQQNAPGNRSNPQTDHQDSGSVQPGKHRDDAPPQASPKQQDQPAPPQQQQQRPPAQQNASPQQDRQHDRGDNPKPNDHKDQKKDDKKDNKKDDKKKD